MIQRHQKFSSSFGSDLNLNLDAIKPIDDVFNDQSIFNADEISDDSGSSCKLMSIFQFLDEELEVKQVNIKQFLDSHEKFEKPNIKKCISI